MDGYMIAYCYILLTFLANDIGMITPSPMVAPRLRAILLHVHI